MERILVIGTTGSGKSTLSRRLARDLDAPHLELDALFWKPDGSASDTAEFRARVAEATAGDRWVVDGNYPSVLTSIWERADTIVWLDMPLSVFLGRVIRRRLSHGFRPHGPDRNNPVLQPYVRRKGESRLAWARRQLDGYRAAFNEAWTDEKWSSIDRVRLRSPREVRRWLSQVSK